MAPTGGHLRGQRVVTYEANGWSLTRPMGGHLDQNPHCSAIIRRLVGVSCLLKSFHFFLGQAGAFTNHANIQTLPKQIESNFFRFLSPRFFGKGLKGKRAKGFLDLASCSVTLHWRDVARGLHGPSVFLTTRKPT